MEGALQLRASGSLYGMSTAWARSAARICGTAVSSTAESATPARLVPCFCTSAALKPGTLDSRIPVESAAEVRQYGHGWPILRA